MESIGRYWPRAPSCLVAVLCGLALLWAFTRWRPQPHHKLPPGPCPLPVVGNLLHLIGDLPHVHLARLAERYGPLMCLRMGSKPMVVASSAHVAREFLQTHDRVFASRPPFQFVERASFGEANVFVLAPYGPHWRHIRKLATLNLFSARRVQETQPLRGEEVARLLRGLLAAANAAASVDLSAAMSRMVEDLMCRIILSRRTSDVAGGGATFKQLAQRATELFQVPVLGDFISWLGFLDIYVKRSLDKLHLDSDALWESVIAKREEQHKLAHLQQDRSSENVPRDILDVFLSDPSISRRAVKGYLTDLVGAGIDTTSVTLDWTMAELLNNPPVRKKLQAELEKVVGLGRTVEASDIEKLPYVTATVKEALRLYAPVSLLVPHMAREACEVMGYSLPAGTRLLVNAWAIGRDPAMWEDPERFWPERFLRHGSDEGPAAIEQFSWLPFSAGRRSCPGAPLALATLELTIANLVHCFDWQLLDGATRVDMSAKTSTVVYRAQPLLATPILRVHAASLSQSK